MAEAETQKKIHLYQFCWLKKIVSLKHSQLVWCQLLLKFWRRKTRGSSPPRTTVQSSSHGTPPVMQTIPQRKNDSCLVLDKRSKNGPLPTHVPHVCLFSFGKTFQKEIAKPLNLVRATAAAVETRELFRFFGHLHRQLPHRRQDQHANSTCRFHPWAKQNICDFLGLKDT